MSTGSNKDSAASMEKILERGEKQPAQVVHSSATEKLGDHGARILNIGQLEGGVKGMIKTAKDGQTVLIPQPSDDPNDPLNWNPLKKHITLIVIAVVAFMADFGSSMGAVTVLPQAT